MYVTCKNIQPIFKDNQESASIFFSMIYIILHNLATDFYSLLDMLTISKFVFTYFRGNLLLGINIWEITLGKTLLGNFNFGKPLLGKQPLGNSPWESTLGKLLSWEYAVMGIFLLGNHHLGKHPLGKPPLGKIPWETSGSRILHSRRSYLSLMHKKRKVFPISLDKHLNNSFDFIPQAD